MLDYEDPETATVEEFGALEPYLAETDFYVALPVRLAHGCLSDWVIEVGPYTLSRQDVETLRQAISAYDSVRRN